MREISITEIEGFKIGHAQDEVHGTGCSVIICDDKAVCGIDVRGGGPASRESQLLNPLMSNDGVNAVVLSGGSAYGLDAAGGVMKYLEQQGKGVKVGDNIVPIVVQSCVFDLGCADGSVRPDAQMGYNACLDAERNKERNGNVGGGMGATVGKILGADTTMKSGLGCYAVQVGDLKVGAMVIVNAIGDVYKVDSDVMLAGLLSKDKSNMISTSDMMLSLYENASFKDSTNTTNTTIAAIVTNGKFTKAEINKIAAMASNGLARTIRPVNTSMDGDSVYALSTGAVLSSADIVGTLAADVLAKAVNRAVLEADELYGFKAAKSFI